MANQNVRALSVFKGSDKKEVARLVNEKLIKIICKQESNDTVKYVEKK